jgi:hypothetical protein
MTPPPDQKPRRNTVNHPIELPDLELPDLELPDLELPDLELPDLTAEPAPPLPTDDEHILTP